MAKLNFDKLVNDQTISEESRAQIAQLTTLLKLAAYIIGDSMAPQIGNAAEMERRRSVVATGLPESLSDIPSERVAEDHNTVTRLLDQLGVECPVTSYRMGNRAQMRITITHWSKKRAELRKIPQMQRLNLRESLTPEQLLARREMQNECTAKRAQTGQDWIIYNDRLILRDDIKGKSTAMFPPTVSLINHKCSSDKKLTSICNDLRFGGFLEEQQTNSNKNNAPTPHPLPKKTSNYVAHPPAIPMTLSTSYDDISFTLSPFICSREKAVNTNLKITPKVRSPTKLVQNSNVKPKKNISQYFKGCLTNARSILNKTDLLLAFLNTEKVNFLIITETWLKNQNLTIFNSILPENYQTFSATRAEKKMGRFYYS